MTEAVAEYRVKYYELLSARELDGGDLSQEEEAHRCSQLEALWWELTEEEQATFERDLLLPQATTPHSDNPLFDLTTDLRAVVGASSPSQEPAGG
jgi:hypothetical protein